VRRGCLVVSRTHRARARKRAAGETGLWAWVGLGGSAIAEDADHEGVLPLEGCFCFVVVCCVVMISLVWSGLVWS
jgi:hypothetical protein